MPNLNLDVNFFDHPKTQRLVANLGPNTESCILRLWCHAGKFHSDDGIFRGYNEAELEAIAKWTGARGEFVNTAIRVGFLIRLEDGFAIHDWHESEGHLKMLRERARNAAQKRWGFNGKAGDKDKMQQACHKHATSNPPSLPSIPSIPPVQKPLCEEAIKLVDAIESMLKANGVVKIPARDKGIRDADLLIRIDKRPLDEAISVLAWATKDSFWKSNILSIGKFRAKYDQLRLRMQSNGNSGSRTEGSATPTPGKFEGAGL